MKFTALVLAATVLLPGALQAQVVRSDPSDKLKELKQKYKNGGQRPDLDSVETGAITRAVARRARYLRYVKGPDGYTLKQLVECLNWTEQNIGGLIDYIHPWQKGVDAPTGEDLAAAQRDLVKESAAAAELIADADAAFAKGIPRDLQDPNNRPRPVIMFATRPTFAYKQPTPEQRVLVIAGAQANVLGHSAALIEYKRLNPPDAEGEAKTESWLEGARKSLAARENQVPE